eukprot:TRINITY_DN44592_c0_g1_i2.p3 TRINITY_DN44592_c0_g1~~TRINITY_DN44592_c0_g1_i2.p3  ORF type:complete len:186 (-),score=40.18 TRINITY_DN44592_c0_g1_i2:159-716(-)
MGTLDRLRQKGSTVGDDLRDVQNSLVSWSAKCDQFQEEAAESIEQIKRDLHQQLMQAQREFASEGEGEDDEETEGSIEGSSQHGENEFDIDQFGENRQPPLLGHNADRILAEVQNNIAQSDAAKNTADKTVTFNKVDLVQTSDGLSYKEAGRKVPSLAQQQLLKIQDHVNQATAFLNGPGEVLGN